MKKKELFELYHGLKSVEKFSGVKFAYAVAKNLRNIEPLLKEIEKDYLPSKEFLEFEEERLQIAKTFSNEQDNNMIWVPKENIEEFSKLLEPIIEKYKDVINQKEINDREYQKIIEEEIEISLYKIHIDNLPNDINAEQIQSIMSIIME